MKKFKNFFLAAVAVAMFGLTSCNNDDVKPYIVEGESYMAIRLGGVVATRDASTGHLEAPGLETPGTIQLEHAHVFVLNSVGGVIHSQGIATDAVTILTVDGTPAGDNRRVLLTNTIYVIGNTPEDYRAGLAALTSLAQINAFFSAITEQPDYAYVVLANVNGVPIPVSAGSPVAAPIPGNNPADEMREVTVTVSPVISRLELHDVNSVEGYHPTTLEVTRSVFDESTGSTTTTTTVETIQARFYGWEVTGVFLDNTFGNFTYGGHGNDVRWMGLTTYAQLQDLLDDDLVPYYIVGNWPANASMVAAPPAPNVWAFNVASGVVVEDVTLNRRVPRLIIRIENASWVPHEDYDWRVDAETGDPLATFGDAIEIEGISFITVTGYVGVNAFTRGNIYRIGSTVNGSDGFTFTINSIIDELPINPEYLDVRVRVEIQEWQWFPTTPIW